MGSEMEEVEGDRGKSGGRLVLSQEGTNSFGHAGCCGVPS